MTTSIGAPSFPFPHPQLTQVVGKPTAITIKHLRKEIYANARSVHSERGGGANGFLGIVMETAPYLARAGEAFILPTHPGTQPAHAATATQAQITATNRQYDAKLDDFRRYTQVREAMRQQILTAVDSTFYDVLEDETFGYADVTIITLLQHLHNEYALLTDDDLENNRKRLSEPWTPDEPFETLWTKIKHLRAVAHAGGEPLTDSTVIRLTLISLEQAGVYAHSIRNWRDKPETDKTWANFIPHFTLGEKERIRSLTAAAAGYHGANIDSIPQPMSFLAAARVPSAPSHITVGNGPAPNTDPGPLSFHCNGVPLSYCWTHGLNRNPQHTSATCSHPSEGHKTDATLDNRKGGSGRITFGDRPTRIPRRTTQE
jgi:hypothetical protein